MFTTFILILHIIVCIVLILIILLQTGKGADIGAVFGGGSSQTLFGSSGATPFLSKVTIGAAVVFMMTSIILTYFSGKGIQTQQSVVSEVPATHAPMIPEGTPPPQPAAGTEQQPSVTPPQTPEGSTSQTSSPSTPPTTQSEPAAPPVQQPVAPAPAAPAGGEQAPESN